MPSPTLRLGSLPPLRVSPGTLVTIALFAVLLFPALSPSGGGPLVIGLLALASGLLLVASVLVHEIAHAAVARAFGARIDHIALTLWGGHTQYRARRMSAGGSILVSLAGPAANGLLALLFTAAGNIVDPGSGLAVLVSTMSWLNIVLALFNLLPGLPMDGGRALESVLGAVLRDEVVGTRITAWLGRAIAVGVVLWPLSWIVRGAGSGLSLLMLVWAILIASMLWQGATAALDGARTQGRVRTLDAAALAQPRRLVGPTTTLGALDALRGPDAHDAPAADPLAEVLVLDPGGARPGTIGRAHAVDPEAAASVPPQLRAGTPVAAVTAPLGEVVALPVTLRGEALVEAMLGRPAPVYLVVEADGSPRGVILSADVSALLRAR